MLFVFNLYKQQNQNCVINALSQVACIYFLRGKLQFSKLYVSLGIFVFLFTAKIGGSLKI